MLSLATDYLTSTGSAEPYLRRIAAAGFGGLHWCHQWNTDYLYSTAELEQFAHWMRTYGLVLTDVHGSEGQEKNWLAVEEYARVAGVELALNRLQMVARLGGDVLVMHLPGPDEQVESTATYWERVWRTLDALQPYSRVYGVKIALENLNPGHFETIARVFEHYGPDYIGLCYDSGHANLHAGGLDYLERFRSRLLAVHLHDNDGSADQHRLPFTGTIDWARLARLLAASAYTKGVSMELSMRSCGFSDEGEFLAQAYQTGQRLAAMVAAAS